MCLGAVQVQLCTECQKASLRSLAGMQAVTLFAFTKSVLHEVYRDQHCHVAKYFLYSQLVVSSYPYTALGVLLQCSKHAELTACALPMFHLP